MNTIRFIAVLRQFFSSFFVFFLFCFNWNGFILIRIGTELLTVHGNCQAQITFKTDKAENKNCERRRCNRNNVNNRHTVYDVIVALWKNMHINNNKIKKHSLLQIDLPHANYLYHVFFYPSSHCMISE